MAENLRINEQSEPAGEPKEPSEEEILNSLGFKKGQKITLSENFWNVGDRGKSGSILGIDIEGDLIIGDENGRYFSHLGRHRFHEIKKHIIFEEPPSGEQEESKESSMEEEPRIEPIQEEATERQKESNKTTLESLGLEAGSEIEYQGKRWRVGHIDSAGDLSIDRVGVLEERELGSDWILGPQNKEDLEGRGVKFLPSGGEEAGKEIEFPPLPRLDLGEEETPPAGTESAEGEKDPDLLERLGFTPGQRMEIKEEGELKGKIAIIRGISPDGDLLFNVEGEEDEYQTINGEKGIRDVFGLEKPADTGEEGAAAEEESKEPSMEGETAKIKPIQEKTAGEGEEREEKGMRPKDAERKLFGRQWEKIKNLDAFQGEAMPENEVKNLKAFVTELQEVRTAELVERWLSENSDDALEHSYGKEMDAKKKFELVRRLAGDGYFEEDSQWRQLASLAEDIEMSGGKLSYESTLLANFYLNYLQGDTAAELSENPEDKLLQVRRDRILRTREALYKSLYKKEVPYNEEEAKQLTLRDPRVDEDYQRFINELNQDALLQRKAESLPGLDSLTIIALESQGYALKPQKKKGIRGFFNPAIIGVDYFKDGKEVIPPNFRDIRLLFGNQKKEEFAQKYLPEKINELKIDELSSIASMGLEDFERLVEDQENRVKAKIIEITERARLKKEDLAEAKRYQEMYKDKGENMKEKLKETVGDWDMIKQYDENSFDTGGIFTGLGDTEKNYAQYMTPEDKKSLLKSKERGPFWWMYSIFKFIKKIEQMTEIK